MKLVVMQCIAGCVTVVCGAAHAQSSVTLYGLMDAGVTYTNNAVSSTGHGALVQFASGSSQGDRWGVTGKEDLGGGLSAIFTLESGFQLSNGGLAQSGLLFNREAYVGFNGYFGTLTVGRQYDFIGDIFPAYSIAGNTAAGILAWGLPAYAAGGYTLDNRLWGDNINNSVKYLSPVISGFSAGAMYGFGNVAGSMGTNSSMNFLLNYSHGGLAASLSYFKQHNATDYANLTEYAGGASYSLGRAQIFGVVTDVQLSSGTKVRAVTYDGGATYFLRPDLSLGAGFQFQDRNNGVASANQVTIGADYFISKRTDVYFVGALAHDHGYGAQIEAALGSPSSTDFQTAARVGIRHKF
ncbi:porin [Paraburkholderia tropica]|uniref:porin n=1 Tax=Paraburkholderia tropica TaxID=92647 RepID=UPI002AB7DFB2|nr:porin [Paraburkholderia tropica]